MEKKINHLKPSQFYLSASKLAAIEVWLNEETSRSMDPIIIRKINGVDLILDGHSRAFIAFRLGIKQVPVQYDEEDQWPFYQKCYEEASKRGIISIADLAEHILEEQDYQKRWLGYCQSLGELGDK